MNATTTSRTARRRTLRIAAAVLTAAAGLTLTACSGSDTADAKPAKQTVVTDSAKSGADDATSGKQSDAGTPAANAKTGSKTGTPDRTQTLADGSTAEIYQLGEQQYRLKIVKDGSVLATLDTDGHDAGLDANGMYVTLTLGGQVHSWMGGEHKAPGTFQLAGGWTAKVTKLGDLRYRAEILGNDNDVMATLETKGHDVGLDANGVAIVLSTRGVISSHE